MACDIEQYRARVGLFYPVTGKCKGRKRTKPYSNKPCNPAHIVMCYYILTIIIAAHHSNSENSHNKLIGLHRLSLRTKKLTLALALVTSYLLLLAGDVHTNPGPNIVRNNTNIESLPCYFLNARSIKSIDNNQHKMREFKELLYTTNPAILGVSETWLTKHIPDTEIATEEEFTIYRKDREGKKGGGVMLLIDPTIKSDRRKKLEANTKDHNEIIVTEVEFGPGNTYALITAYRSQQDPFPQFLHNFSTVLENCIKANLTKILVMGDFNYSNITWDSTKDLRLPPNCLEFMSTINCNGLTQLNHNPSRANNQNILDLILTNEPDCISPIYANLFTYRTDHYLLHFDLTTTVDRLVKPNRTVFNFKNVD